MIPRFQFLCAAALILTGCASVNTRTPFGEAFVSTGGHAFDRGDVMASLTGEWATPGLKSDSDLRPIINLRMKNDGTGEATITEVKSGGAPRVGQYEVRITRLPNTANPTRNGMGHEPFAVFLRNKAEDANKAGGPRWSLLWLSFPLNGIEKESGVEAPEIVIVTAPSAPSRWKDLGFLMGDANPSSGDVLNESPEKIVERLYAKDPRLLMATGTTAVFTRRHDAGTEPAKAQPASK